MNKQSPKKKNIQRNERRKARIAAVRQWIKEYQNSLKCEICGESDYFTLDFHRRDFHPVEYSIKRVLTQGKSLKWVKRKAKSNQVLCANCHRKIERKHYEDRISASF